MIPRLRKGLVLASRGLLTFRRVRVSEVAGFRRLSTAVVEARIPSKPINYHSFGIIKIISVSAPFIYVGAYLAASFAAYLEDLDLFVPDDDDD